MDIFIEIIGYCLLITFLLIVSFFIYKTQKKENRMLRMIRKLAKNSQCEISINEYCNDFIIALDQHKKQLFFINQKKKLKITQVVNLLEIQRCEVIKETKEIMNDLGKLCFVESIGLIFINNNKNSIDIKIEMSINDIDHQQSEILLIMEKWNTIINENLK
jgi:hypothetical protein